MLNELRNFRKIASQHYATFKIASQFAICEALIRTLLPQNKFGLNIILPSTKFVQCQTVCRTALKYSPNQDIKNLWAITSNNKNVQYDIYKDTKDVLKAVRKENEERLQNLLVS